MSRTVQVGLGPMELNRVSASSAPDQTAPMSVRDWQDLPARALGRAGISQKLAAACMGITPGQLSSQLSGREHLSLWRMQELPKPFWNELIPLLAEWHSLSFGSNELARQDAVLGAKVREVVGLLVGPC